MDELKILKKLSIRPVPTIIHKGDIWPHQNLTKQQDPIALQRVVDLEIKNNKGFYTFFKIEVGYTFRIFLDEVPVGNRLDHGEGKRGLSFPQCATQRHMTREDAEKSLSKLKEYFTDLAKNSVFGERSKDSGKIQSNHFLFL